MQKQGVTPFYCYPQFRPPGLDQHQINSSLRECVVLGNTISLSVLPLLVNEELFQSFKAHEAVWDKFGCEISVRHQNMTLEQIGEHHENTAAEEDGTKGQIYEKLARARYLESRFKQFLKRHDGAATQSDYRTRLRECIRRLAKESPDPAPVWLQDLDREIKSAQHDHLDFKRAAVIIGGYTDDERYRATARFAYYENGRVLHGGAIPLIPPEDALAIPNQAQTDVIAILAMQVQEQIPGLRKGMLAELDIADFIKLADSPISEGFARCMQSTLAAIDWNSDSPAVLLKQGAAKIAERYRNERAKQKVFSRENRGATGVDLTIGMASDLPVIGLIQFGIGLMSKWLGPNLGMTPLVSYVKNVQDLAEIEYTRKLSPPSTE